MLVFCCADSEQISKTLWLTLYAAETTCVQITDTRVIGGLFFAPIYKICQHLDYGSKKTHSIDEPFTFSYTTCSNSSAIWL
jgi:hypothetical protein